MCDSHTKKSGRIATEVSLIDNEDIFTLNLCDIHTKESSKISFRKWVKNGNSLNNIIMRKGHEWLKTKQ